MLKIGLSGGIGSGKTIISKFFQTLGVPIYYADENAKILMNSNHEIIENLINNFGTEVYINNNINKDYLTKLVFQSPISRNIINNIVHPVVRNDFEHWSQQFQNKPYIIQESALLFEKDLYKNFDYTITVNAPINIRIERIIKRDNISKNIALNKLNSQKTDEERSQLANFIITNNNIELIIPQILSLHKFFLENNNYGKI